MGFHEDNMSLDYKAVTAVGAAELGFDADLKISREKTGANPPVKTPR